MPDKKSPLKPAGPVLKPLKEDRPIEDILSKDGRLMRSPLLWFGLLMIPVLIGFVQGLNQLKNDPDRRPIVPVTSYTPPGFKEGQVGESSDQPRLVNPDEFVAALGRKASHAPGARNDVIPRGGLIRGAPAPACEFDQWLGQVADTRMQDDFKKVGRPFRILPPGSMMTMDHSPSRVNFDTDAGGKITRVWCG